MRKLVFALLVATALVGCHKNLPWNSPEPMTTESPDIFHSAMVAEHSHSITCYTCDGSILMQAMDVTTFYEILPGFVAFQTSSGKDVSFSGDYTIIDE